MTDFNEKRILSIYNSGSTANPTALTTIPFTGVYEDVINYESASVIINTSVGGNLVIKFLISLLDTNAQEVNFNHAGGQQLYETTMKARYMQISYTGYDAATGTGSISTYLNPYATKETDVAAQYNLANPTEGHLDLFGRLRVSNLETLIDIKHIKGLGINTLNVASLLSGTGSAQTLDTNDPVVHMTVGGTGDSVIRQTRLYTQYQPGKSLLLYMTGRIITNVAQTGVVSQIGYVDDYNGVFFVWDNGVISVGIRSSCDSGVPTNTFIPYTEWNQDRLDGTGPSGVTVNWSSTLIYVINLAWLGVGVVEFGVIWGGKFYRAHTIYNIGNTTTYTATSNLPIRYSIQSTGGAGQMDMICASISSEAGYSIRGSPFSISTNSKTVTAGETYLLGIRLKQDYRSVITLNNMSALCAAGGNLQITIYRYLETNPISGGTWSDTGSMASMEYNTGGTWVLGTPIQLFRTYISSNDLVARIDLAQLDPVFLTAGIGSGANFVSDVIVITARKISASGADRDVEMSIGWVETI